MIGWKGMSSGPDAANLVSQWIGAVTAAEKQGRAHWVRPTESDAETWQVLNALLESSGLATISFCLRNIADNSQRSSFRVRIRTWMSSCITAINRSSWLSTSILAPGALHRL